MMPSTRAPKSWADLAKPESGQNPDANPANSGSALLAMQQILSLYAGHDGEDHPELRPS